MNIQLEIIEFEKHLRQSPMYKAAEFQLKQSGQHYSNRDVILLCCMGVVRDNMNLIKMIGSDAPETLDDPPST